MVKFFIRSKRIRQECDSISIPHGAERRYISALLLSFCQKKQKSEEGHMGCGFPALDSYLLFSCYFGKRINKTFLVLACPG